MVAIAQIGFSIPQFYNSNALPIKRLLNLAKHERRADCLILGYRSV